MRAVKILLIWLQVGGAAVALLAILWLGAQELLHLQLLAVQTGSMQPMFQPGDAVVIQRTSLASVRPGDIVSYHSTRNPNELITHRVVNTNQAAGSFRTKGDRLTTPDPTVRGSLLVGKVKTILPGLGNMLGWLRTWPGLTTCIYLPAGALAVSEFYRLEQYYRRLRPYSLKLS